MYRTNPVQIVLFELNICAIEGGCLQEKNCFVTQLKKPLEIFDKWLVDNYNISPNLIFSQHVVMILHCFLQKYFLKLLKSILSKSWHCGVSIISLPILRDWWWGKHIDQILRPTWWIFIQIYQLSFHLWQHSFRICVCSFHITNHKLCQVLP